MLRHTGTAEDTWTEKFHEINMGLSYFFSMKIGARLFTIVAFTFYGSRKHLIIKAPSFKKWHFFAGVATVKNKTNDKRTRLALLL